MKKTGKGIMIFAALSFVMQILGSIIGSAWGHNLSFPSLYQIMIWAITSGIIAIIGLVIYLAGKKEKSHVNDNFVQLQSDGSWACPHCHYKNTKKGLCENCLFMPTFEFINE